MVNLRAYRFGVALAVVTLMLAGCTRTVQGSGDYPTYDEKSLAETATLVVEGDCALDRGYCTHAPV